MNQCPMFSWERHERIQDSTFGRESNPKSSRIQTPSSGETSSSGHRNVLRRLDATDLEFEVWSFSGAGFIICIMIPLLVVFLPGYVAAKRLSPCFNFLRQIDAATQQWAVEHQKGTNVVPTWDELRPYLREVPRCPQGGTYTLGTVGGGPACSIAGQSINVNE